MMRIEESCVSPDVREYVIRKAQEGMEKRRIADKHMRKRAWKTHREKYFGWMTWTNMFIIAGLMGFLITTRSAYAEAANQSTTLVPSKEAVEYPSVTVYLSESGDQKALRQFKLIIRGFIKVGMQESSRQSTEVSECHVMVISRGYQIACFTKSMSGNCKLGPAMSTRFTEVIDHFGAYYRGCSMNGIISKKTWS